MGELIVLRHGETQWSRQGRHTGRTDLPLTPAGEAAATALAPALAARPVRATFTSPARRAVLTARWLRLEPGDGRLFQLKTATLSTLGTEHGEPVITSWNVPPTALPS